MSNQINIQIQQAVPLRSSLVKILNDLSDNGIEVQWGACVTFTADAWPMFYVRHLSVIYRDPLCCTLCRAQGKWIYCSWRMSCGFWLQSLKWIKVTQRLLYLWRNESTNQCSEFQRFRWNFSGTLHTKLEIALLCVGSRRICAATSSGKAI